MCYFYATTLRGGVALRIALDSRSVCHPSEKFVTKFEKRGHLCGMDKFLVYLSFVFGIDLQYKLLYIEADGSVENYV